MKNFYYFLVCVAYIFNLGGIGYLFYYKQPQFAVTAILVAAMAFPYIKKCFRILIPKINK